MNLHLPWHQSSLESMQNRFTAGSLVHALLVSDSGREVASARNFAMELATLMLCQSGQIGGCNSCNSCHFRRAGSHADLRWVHPEETKQIKIEQVRTAIEWSHQTAQQGLSKVLVLDTVDQMNLYASNALLKLLEEPVANTFIILISNQPSQLLPTIRSRCQMVYLAAASETAAKAWLEARHSNLAAEAIESLYTMTGQLPLTTDRFLAVDGQGDYLGLIDGLLAWFHGEVSGVKAAQLLQSKIQPELLFEVLYRAISQAQRFQCVPPGARELSRFEQLAEVLSQSLERRQLLRLAERCVEVRQALLAGHNLNPGLLLERFVLNTKVG
ncbi:MAG: hypothetical protein O2949_08320 [Proteobacteria bacterium]|nr:hypothetical protein [Pseudomonadota bacterium]